MANLEDVPFDNICRICHEPKELSLIHEIQLYCDIQKKLLDLTDVYEKYTSVKISENDHKPQKMCDGCIRMLCQSYNFLESCILSEQLLNAVLENKKLQHDTEQTYKKAENANYSASSENVFDKTNIHNIKGENLIGSVNDKEEIAYLPKSELNTHNNQESVEMNDISDCSYEQKAVLPHKKSFRNPREETSCQKCDVTYTTFEELFAHFKEVHRADKACIFGCKREYTSWRFFQYHMKVAHGKRIGCKTCIDAFNTLEELEEHYKTNEHNNICDICNKSFTKKSFYKAHKGSHKANFKCDKCPAVYLRQNSLRKHIRRDHDLHRYPCQECGKEFTQKYKLLQHLMKDHRQSIKHKCDKCGLEIPEQALEKHKSLHEKYDICLHEDGEQKYEKHICDICGATFTFQVELTSHLMSVHRPSYTKRFKHCKICKLDFDTPGAFFIHVKRHKQNTCDLCELSFPDKGTWREHIKIHTQKDTKYHCGRCGKQFAKQEHLSLHEQTHTEQEKNICNFCGKEFLVPSHLKAHYLVKHSDKLQEL